MMRLGSWRNRLLLNGPIHHGTMSSRDSNVIEARSEKDKTLYVRSVQLRIE